MGANEGAGGWFGRGLLRLGTFEGIARRWASVSSREPAIGLALGGGFARGIAHIGVLRVFEQNQVPIRYIAGVSAGAIVAAAYASGTSPDEIARIAATMRFRDVASWSISKMGFSSSKPMEAFLEKLLKKMRFEEMRIPLLVAATDLNTGEPVCFHSKGDVRIPVRASCSYPGMFQPVAHQGRLLVDGAVSVDIPALPLRRLGATRVVAVNLPMQQSGLLPLNLFQVVNRCFQIMQKRLQPEWRKFADVVIEPDVTGHNWDGFVSAAQMIKAGEKAAFAALPEIRKWLDQWARATARNPAPAAMVAAPQKS
jgi:NTE family protein